MFIWNILFYNCGKYIPQLVKSLKGQVDGEFECIFIDDNSRDNTYEITRNFISGDNRFKIFKARINLGSGGARNYGVEKASNDILLFLDSDTIPFPQLVREVKKFFSNYPGRHAVTGISDYLSADKGVFSGFLAAFDYFDTFYKKDEIITLFDPRVSAIKKRLFLEIGGFETKYKWASIEDYELSSRLMERAKIYLNKKMLVSHYFPGFKKFTFSYFPRACEWFKFFVKNPKLGNYGNATLFGTFTVFLSILFCFFFVSGIFLRNMFWCALMVYAVIAGLYIEFLFFSFKKPGCRLKSSFYPVLIIYFFTVCALGAVLGAIQLILLQKQK